MNNDYKKNKNKLTINEKGASIKTWENYFMGLNHEGRYTSTPRLVERVARNVILTMLLSGQTIDNTKSNVGQVLVHMVDLFWYESLMNLYNDA